MKTCTKCGETKPLEGFTRDKHNKQYGRTAQCKECRNAAVIAKYTNDEAYAERRRQTALAWSRGEEVEPLPKKSIDERFDEKWEEDENGCWIWQAKTDFGYGRFKVDGKTVRAHRWSYEREYGAIPESLELHHKCGNRACVRPSHLLAVTEEAHRELHKDQGDYSPSV